MFQLSPRDRELLQLLDRTPATATLVLKASVTFAGGPFHDERRARERLRSLIGEGVVRSYRVAVIGGGLANYYRLTPEGYRVVRGADTELPHRSQFAELPPSRLTHTLELAEAIVHTLVAAHTYRLILTHFHREGELALEIGTRRIEPDCHMQFTVANRTFNTLLELDRSTESLDSAALTSIRSKLQTYEAYQDFVLAQWHAGGRRGPRPGFRVTFLTATMERAHHILALAREYATNGDRRLCYAAPLASYLAEPDAARAPVLLDHYGCWQALVNVHPTSRFQRSPVRIAPLVQSALFV